VVKVAACAGGQNRYSVVLRLCLIARVLRIDNQRRAAETSGPGSLL
jgi:hypothetical protein